MPNQPSDRPSFPIEIPTLQIAFCVIIGLATALEHAIESAIFIDRAEVDSDSIDVRIETLAKQLIREAKNVPTEFISEFDETAGIATAIAMIDECVCRVRRRH